MFNIKSLENCEVLNSNLVFLHQMSDLNETDLQILKSLKIINGFVRIQSDKLTSLNFLKNLEIIRATDLM